MEPTNKNTDQGSRIESEVVVPTDPVELREVIRKQVEYYFSKDNLQHDPYLTSQMDANMSVPINVIMKFAKVKSLTQDEAVLREALTGSTVVSIVDNKIKAIIKGSNRSTIILRDIPSETPEEEVRTIFAFDGCKPIVSVRKDIENTWFVIMESEEDAKDTVLDIKLKKRTFRGEPVKCRVKTEAVVKSFYPVAAGAAVPGGYSLPVNNYSPQYPPVDMRQYGYGWQQGAANNAEGSEGGSSPTSKGNTAAAQQGQDLRQGAAKDAQGANRVGVRDVRDRKGQQGRDRSQQQGGAGVVGGRADSRGQQQQGGKSQQVQGGRQGGRRGGDVGVKINAADFPPLAAPAEEVTEVPKAGYQTSFKKYSHDEVLNIVKNITEVTLPSSIKPSDHTDAMTTTANMDLLLRQRTFSIDETREQLRQGRPVQRDAVLSGAIDYDSMIYGDVTATNEGAAGHRAVAAEPIAAGPPAAPKASGSWAGVVMKATPPDAPIITPKPVVPPSPAKKPAASTAAASAAAEPAKSAEAPAGDKKQSSSSSKSEGGERKPKGEKKPKERRAEESSTKEASVQAEVTVAASSWGGRLTFASILKIQGEEPEPLPVPASPARKPAAAASSASKTSGGAEGSNKRSGDRSRNGASSSSSSSSRAPREGGASRSGRRGDFGSSAETKQKANSSEPWGKETLPPAADAEKN